MSVTLRVDVPLRVSPRAQPIAEVFRRRPRQLRGAARRRVTLVEWNSVSVSYLSLAPGSTVDCGRNTPVVELRSRSICSGCPAQLKRRLDERVQLSW